MDTINYRYVGRKVKLYEILSRIERQHMGTLTNLYVDIEEAKERIERVERQIKMLNEMKMILVKVDKR